MTDRLVIIVIGDKRKLHSDFLVNGFLVPSGFVFNGASIPRFGYSLIGGPYGDYVESACLHDFLYDSQPDGMTRRQADVHFYEHMLENGIPKFKAWLMFWSVRAFGGKSWRQK